MGLCFKRMSFCYSLLKKPSQNPMKQTTCHPQSRAGPSLNTVTSLTPVTWWETTHILMALSNHHQLRLSRKQSRLLFINIHDVTGKGVREPWCPRRRVRVLYQGLKSRTAEQCDRAERHTHGSQGMGNQKLLRLGKNFQVLDICVESYGFLPKAQGVRCFLL